MATNNPDARTVKPAGTSTFKMTGPRASEPGRACTATKANGISPNSPGATAGRASANPWIAAGAPDRRPAITAATAPRRIR